MNNNSKLWMMPLAGSLMFAATARGQEPAPALERAYLDSTNRLTVSLRFGLNISGSFKGAGSSFNPGATAGSGHYADGFVLTDVSGNFGGQTWNWGYQNPGQVNASAPNSIDFHNYTAPGLPKQGSQDNSPYVGCEIAYNYEIGVKEDWHHLAYGIEAAANYMPIAFNIANTYSGSVSQQTDTYGYVSGTTPPGAPYSGSYEGPGFLINVPRINTATAVIPGATLETHQNFYANLWGFRLGPYLESPLTEKIFLHVSGGFAAGLLDANADWNETLALPGNILKSRGGGSDFDVLYGFYAGADAIYRFNEKWGVDVGVQFQNLGTYDHNFGGRTASLDLSKSIFVQAGLSYSF